jgi:hypothetical protein
MKTVALACLAISLSGCTIATAILLSPVTSHVVTKAYEATVRHYLKPKPTPTPSYAK